MKVWQILLALLGHLLRGRGRHLVYLVADGLPHRPQEELDSHELVVVRTYAPRRRDARFLVLIARATRRHG